MSNNLTLQESNNTAYFDSTKPPDSIAADTHATLLNAGLDSVFYNIAPVFNVVPVASAGLAGGITFDQPDLENVTQITLSDTSQFLMPITGYDTSAGASFRIVTKDGSMFFFTVTNSTAITGGVQLDVTVEPSAVTHTWTLSDQLLVDLPLSASADTTPTVITQTAHGFTYSNGIAAVANLDDGTENVAQTNAATGSAAVDYWALDTGDANTYTRVFHGENTVTGISAAFPNTADRTLFLQNDGTITNVSTGLDTVAVVGIVSDNDRVYFYPPYNFSNDTVADDLEATLAAGNTSGANDIQMADGQNILMADGDTEIRGNDANVFPFEIARVEGDSTQVFQFGNTGGGDDSVGAGSYETAINESAGWFASALNSFARFGMNIAGTMNEIIFSGSTTAQLTAYPNTRNDGVAPVNVLHTDVNGNILSSPASTGVTDHGALTGLGDDDHTQYALADGSRGSFATTAQGALADTALQSGDNISELVNDVPYLTDIVSKMPMVNAQCAAQDINDNGDLLFNASTRSDTGWNHAGPSNSFDFTGSPDRVIIEMQVSAQIGQTQNIQRPAAVIALFRNGVLVAESKTGYIRDGNDHEETSYTIVYTDPAPGTNPVYTLTTRQESTQGGVVTSDLHSFITMTAILA